MASDNGSSEGQPFMGAHLVPCNVVPHVPRLTMGEHDHEPKRQQVQKGPPPEDPNDYNGLPHRMKRGEDFANLVLLNAMKFANVNAHSQCFTRDTLLTQHVQAQLVWHKTDFLDDHTAAFNKIAEGLEEVANKVEGAGAFDTHDASTITAAVDTLGEAMEKIATAAENFRS